jgi:hypothetical protein
VLRLRYDTACAFTIAVGDPTTLGSQMIKIIAGSDEDSCRRRDNKEIISRPKEPLSALPAPADHPCPCALASLFLD